MAQSILSNIPRLYVIKIAKWFMLFMPVIVLFYQENGLSLEDVFLLQGIYSIAVVLLEIPSGYFADVWGRKFTIIAGSILGVVGFIIYVLTSGFWGFLIAELILGIGQSFISGSDSALLYDSLLFEKKEKEYIKIEGRIISIGNFAESIAAVAGGYLAEISLRMPFIVQIGIAILAVPAAITLVEPKLFNKHKASLTQILFVVKNTLFKDKLLQSNILYSSVIGTATLTFAWFVQPYLKMIDYSVTRIGIIWAFLNLTVAFSTLFAYRIEELLGKTKTIIAISLIISAGYFATGIGGPTTAVVFMFVLYLGRGIATPVLKDYINRLTTSNIRATVLSVRNFTIRFLFAVLGPFLGWYSDKFSIKTALWLAGIIFFTISIAAVIQLIIVEKKQR